MRIASKTIAHTATLIALGFASRCSSAPSTPTAFCNQLAQTTCDRLYACATGSALDLIKAKYGDSPSQCAAFEQGQFDCANVQCSNFSSASAQSCIDSYNAATCDALAGGPPTVCNEVCGSLGGADAAPDSSQDVTPLVCSSGLTACGTCVDTNSNPNNCGGCGVACASGKVCSQGSCSVETCIANTTKTCSFDGECCTLYCNSNAQCGCIPSGSVACTEDAHCCSSSCDVAHGVCN